MRIFVKKHVPLVFYIPNRLICSRFSVFLILKAMQQDGISMEQKHLSPLLQQCCGIFRQHRGLTFVEVTASDGTRVKITL